MESAQLLGCALQNRVQAKVLQVPRDPPLRCIPPILLS